MWSGFPRNIVPVCMIRGKCACFRAKMVEISGHLPSGSFWWKPNPMQTEHDEAFEWLTTEIAHQPSFPVAFSLVAGTLENQPDLLRPTLLQATRRLRDVLTAKGSLVH